MRDYTIKTVNTVLDVNKLWFITRFRAYFARRNVKQRSWLRFTRERVKTTGSNFEFNIKSSFPFEIEKSRSVSKSTATGGYFSRSERSRFIIGVTARLYYDFICFFCINRFVGLNPNDNVFPWTRPWTARNAPPRSRSIDFLGTLNCVRPKTIRPITNAYDKPSIMRAADPRSTNTIIPYRIRVIVVFLLLFVARGRRKRNVYSRAILFDFFRFVRSIF
jgi:hypothetical protein